MAGLRITGLAIAAVLGSSMTTGQASAMPANGLAPAASHVADGLENVRYVCGPYRCWWTPGSGPYWGSPYYGYYGYVGPRPYWRGYYGYYGWHRRWGW